METQAESQPETRTAWMRTRRILKEEVETAEVTASITFPSVGRGFPAVRALRLGLV